MPSVLLNLLLGQTTTTSIASRLDSKRRVRSSDSQVKEKEATTITMANLLASKREAFHTDNQSNGRDNNIEI
jgi:hypothetical protein